jgi:hypothetical protein
VANAIHSTSAGDTLASVSRAYYALEGPPGDVRDVDLKKVCHAIRSATGALPGSVADADPLPAGTTLFVPTLRELNRVVFTEHVRLLADLHARGFHHARKLLRYTPAQVVAHLSPLPDDYSAQDVRRAWMLTALLNVDGMDLFSARHLYDAEGITSLQELADQSQATLDRILSTLVAPPHSRPAALATQGHGKRWRLAARIQVRNRLGALTRIKNRFFQVPVTAATASRQAAFYEALAADAGTTPDDATRAARLGRLYRFQSAVVRGHVGLRSRNWAEAIAGYRDARRQWHRLAEDTGAARVVDDVDGLNLDTCVEVARRLLVDLPGEEDAPMGAPVMAVRRGGERAPYRLRGFRYDELDTRRKKELRDGLADARVHQLPKKVRLAIRRATLAKTQVELTAANDDLARGLTAAPSTALARDFEPRDQALLQRNLGSSLVGALYSGKSGLDVFDEIGADLVVGDISTLLPHLWQTQGATGTHVEPASVILSDEARKKYPADFLKRPDVTPFTRFLVLPGESGRTSPRFVPLTGTFAEDYEREVLAPRLASTRADDLLFDDAVWTSAGAFAAVAPYVYASQIPLGLRQAYASTGQMTLAKQLGGQRVNTYTVEGAIARDIGAAAPSSTLFDPDLLACSTLWEANAADAVELDSYARILIYLADAEYRQDRRDTARSYYADVKCAIGQAYPEFSTEARVAIGGVFNTINAVNAGTFIGFPSSRNLSNLTTLNVQYTTLDGVTHQVMEDTFLVVRTPVQQSTRSQDSTTATLEQYFDWNGVTDIVSGENTTGQEIAEAAMEEESSGRPVPVGGDDVDVYVDHGDEAAPETLSKDEFYTLYLYCEAQVDAIDAGLNWYGYSDEFVPAWSFEHLYGVARDLCNRALEAEQRVFSLLQMYETAEEKEFLASQNEELAGAEVAVAEAQVFQQVAANNVALQQAEYSQQQAAAQAKKSGLVADIAVVTTSIAAAAAAAFATAASGGTAGAAAVAAAPAAVGLITGLAGTITGHTQDVKVLDQAVEVTTATLMSNVAALSVAIAQRDVTALRAEQSSAYVDFLASQTLVSDAYLYLMGLARQILEVYIHHANRMAWLAERALEHETRQTYDLIDLDYAVNDDLTDMTRAQQITADLEALRSEYVAGQTVRLQEITWTFALSQIDAIAWRDLRETGTCTFVLRQRTLDMFFPGMSQHRLKDVRMEIVGLVPPEGARGLLTNAGVSWVRVRNAQSFLSGQTASDWVTDSLATSTLHPQYDEFVMKRIGSNVVTLSLSQFDVRGDRAVLSSPQGMLKPVEHQGLDAAWTLTLHRQSNNFDFRNIVDVELTFWFLCDYDAGLEQAQENALEVEGLQGRLLGTARTAFGVHQPDAFAAFAGPPADPEALDLRYLTVDVGNLPLWEKAQKVTNLLLGCARAASQTREISLRLCCDHDPVGILVTTKDGAVYSIQGIDVSAEEPPPQPDAAFAEWVRQTFYFKRPDIDLPDLPGDPALPGPVGAAAVGDPLIPFRDPAVRWIIKAAPAQIGRGWLAEDEDGNTVSTSSGPLQGRANGVATYREGTRWTNYAFQAKVAHRNGTLRLRLRDDGTSHYALQISPADLRLFRVENGVDALLGSAIARAYPADEFLSVDVRCVGSALSVAIDGLSLFAAIDGEAASATLRQGTIAIQVVATDGAAQVLVDDVRVVRLTGKGLEAEALLSEPFTATLPLDWTFVDGEGPWSIAARGHRLLDLSSLQNVVLSVDYRYQANLGQ